MRTQVLRRCARASCRAMLRRRMRCQLTGLLAVILFIFIFIFFFFSPISYGQVVGLTDQTTTPSPGAGHDYIGMLNETVSPSSGSLSFRIGVPTPPGRKLSLPFAFEYDSNGAWFIQQNA